jgi:hypothetical protein
MDRNLVHQQNLTRLTFGVLVIRAPSNRMTHLQPLLPAINNALIEIRPGDVHTVGA